MGEPIGWTTDWYGYYSVQMVDLTSWITLQAGTSLELEDSRIQKMPAILTIGPLEAIPFRRQPDGEKKCMNVSWQSILDLLTRMKIIARYT